jgi:hypothetical protein
MPSPTQKFEQPQYVLFRSGVVDFLATEQSGHGHYDSDYNTYNLDSIVIIEIKEIEIARRPLWMMSFTKCKY